MKDQEKSKSVSIILQKLKPAKEEPQQSNEYDMMAEDILSAVESKDPKMLAESLKSFIESCKPSEEE